MDHRLTCRIEPGRLTVRRPGHFPATLALTTLALIFFAAGFGSILLAGLRPGAPDSGSSGMAVAILFGGGGLLGTGLFAWMQMRLHCPFNCEIARDKVSVRNGAYSHTSRIQSGKPTLEIRISKGQSSWSVTGYLLAGRHAVLVIPWEAHRSEQEADHVAESLAAQARQTGLFSVKVRAAEFTLADALRDMGLPWPSSKSHAP